MATSGTTDGFKAYSMLSAVLLAVGMLLVLEGIKPAEAAFPGTNGLIAFDSSRVTVTNPTGDREIYTMDPDGNGVTQLTNNTAPDFSPAFSADGTKIAFVSQRDGGAEEIYVMDSDGNNQTRLTNNAARDLAPAFSPSGTKIAFISDRDDNTTFEIYKMDAVDSNSDGNAENQTRLTNNTTSDLNPAWSPGGKKIAFDSNRDGDFEIFTMKPSGTNQTKLTKNTAKDQNPNFSPGGTKIAFDSTRDGSNEEIYTMRSDGTRQRRRTDNTDLDFDPAFSPEGTQIAFVSNRDDFSNFEIYKMDAGGTNPVRLTNSSGDDTGPDWQPL